MSTPKPQSSPTARPRHRRWTFMLWLCFVVVGIAVLALMQINVQLIAEKMPQFESAMVNLLTVVFGVFSLLGLFGWILFFSGWSFDKRLGSIVLLILPLAIGITLFEPVFSGGMFPNRWRPRFWAAKNWETLAAGQADLSRTSGLDFTGFLGNNRDSVVTGIELDPDWDSKPPKIVWQQPIGEGWSGFSAVNGFAVTMEQRGPMECVTCYSIEDGKLVWAFEREVRHENFLGGVGPRSTPTIHAGRVYAQGAVGNLYCLNGADGKLIWEIDLLKLLEIPSETATNGRGEQVTIEQSSVTWGRAGSPLIYKDMVIIPAGGIETKHSLIAFDRQTGDEVWRGGSEQISYGSPSVAKIHDRDQIVVVNESSAAGHDPKSGAELWNFSWPGNSSQDANTSQVTPVGNNRLLLSKGYGAGGELIEIEKDGERFQPKSIWKSARVMKTKLTSPVVSGNHAFAISNEVLECTNIENGERVWKDQRLGHGQLLRVGKHLLAHSETGTLFLVIADPAGFENLGELKTIDGVCWNVLCLYGDQLLVRSDREVACIRIPAN